MGWQHRKGQAARSTQIPLDTLPLLLLFGTGGISVTFIATMLVHHPRTTARALGPLSFELIFSKLNRGAFPNSSPPIKPFYFGLPAPIASPSSTTCRTHVLAGVRSATAESDARIPTNIQSLQQYSHPPIRFKPNGGALMRGFRRSLSSLRTPDPSRDVGAGWKSPEPSSSQASLFSSPALSLARRWKFDDGPGGCLASVQRAGFPSGNRPPHTLMML